MMLDEDEIIIRDTVLIDVSDISGSRELHRLLKDKLDLPDFYGHNWDAFWDAITGLVPLPLNLIFTGTQNLKLRMPNELRTLQKLINDRNEMYSKTRPKCNVSYE